jgi:F0F1-type ATP synthase assembly protein I
MSSSSDDSTAKNIRTAGALSAVGISFVLAVVIGFLIGYALDRWLSTSPLFTLVFFFLGLAAGIVNVVRTASQYLRDQRSDRGSGSSPSA